MNTSKRYNPLRDLICMVAVSGLMVLLCMLPACSTVPKVDPTTGATNMVRQVDPEKLAAIRHTLEPGAARAIAKALARSPQHAAEIRQYGQAVASIFCQMAANTNFSLAYVTSAANAATLDMQSKLVSDPDLAADIAAAKDTLLGLFEIEAASDLTWQLPDNVWLQNVCSLICDVITKAMPVAQATPAPQFIPTIVPLDYRWDRRENATYRTITVSSDDLVYRPGLHQWTSSLPATLDDGENFRKIRDYKEVDAVLSEPAIYEKIPQDASFVFTPSLRFFLHLSDDPELRPLER